MYLHYGCMHTDALLTVMTFTDPASCCMHGKEKGITANSSAVYFRVQLHISYVCTGCLETFHTHMHINNSSCVGLEVVGMCGLRKACA